MAEPAKIFRNVDGDRIHISRAYDSAFDSATATNKKTRYIMMSAGENTTTKFNIYAPVRLKAAVQSQVSSQSHNFEQAFSSASGSSYAFYTIEEDLGVFKKGWYIQFWNIDPSPFVTAHRGSTFPSAGNWRERGEKIGTTKSNHVKIAIFKPNFGSGRRLRAHPVLEPVDPTPFVDFSLGNLDENGNQRQTDPTGTTSDQAVQPGTGEGVDIGSIAKAAAFTTFFSMPSFGTYAESNSLTGQRSLMNDQPLMPFIQQLSMACLRQFMSTPSGDFFAFYPDYFGGLGKTAYWHIEDIEIINGSIELSDDQLATHVYVVGDIAGQPSGAEGGVGVVDWIDRINTGGVVTVFNAFMADFLNGIDNSSGDNAIDSSQYPTLAKKEDAINFLRKYGARPYYDDQPAVRAPIYEAFLAYQTFCLKWSEQFKTQFEFTFMPELFPGGIVAFPKHGLQCYVSSVTHNCSYENGFTTTAELMAPSAFKNVDGSVADPDKSWVHAGMIRSWPNTEAVTQFKGATDTDPAEKDKKK